MPGPQNKRMRGHHAPAPNSPNKRQSARLERRKKSFSAANDKYAKGYRMPGSENRKK